MLSARAIYQEIQNLFHAFSLEAVEGVGSQLSYIDKSGSQVVLDTLEMRLRKYAAIIGEGRPRHPRSTVSIYCDHERFHVQKTGARSPESVPSLELAIPSSYRLP